MLSDGYRRYVLGMLTLSYGIGYIDRNLIILLLQPIKEDLHLSDTQLGFVTGIAFALFYATLGLPIARWADRGNRVTITSAAIALWGVVVMSSALVTNFTQLVVARVAAGIGESGCAPPTYSLVGDYYATPQQRARAMGVYTMGGPLASLAAFAAGGWLNGLLGWRLTFFVLGVPALLIGALVKLTVAEPRVDAYLNTELHRAPQGVGAVLNALWRHRSSRHLTIGVVLLYTMALGMAPWYAAFMMRSHGVSASDLGIWFGLIFGLGGITGTLLGGYVAGHRYAASERGQMRFSSVTIALLVPFFILFLLLPGTRQALAALAPLNVVFCVFLGPTYALMQRLVPSHMRATAMAVVMMLANLIGMGIGPQIVGILSDWLNPDLGNDSLRYAMLAMSLVALWSAYHFWQAGETVEETLLTVSEQN